MGTSSGFWLDGKKLARASFADDLFFIGATKKDLESMIRDAALELQIVGFNFFF